MPRDLARRKQRQAEWYIRNKKDIQADRAESYLSRRALHLTWEARRRARRKGVPYGLSAADVAGIQQVIDIGFCEITGCPFDLHTPRAWNSPSLDQIKAGAGYVPGNVRVVCRAMNFAMGEWGEASVWEMFQCWQSMRKSRQSLSRRTSKAGRNVG